MKDKECWKKCEYANPQSEIISAYLMKKKENEQLKAQIEKMKCCGNCSKWYECSKEKQMLFKLHKNCDEWELAE